MNVSGTGDLPVAPGTSDHPDHDLLADLAAEVLADDLAGQVQEHVVDCPECAGLLAEAEGIRTLLRQGEPERMPDDVMERLAAALAEVAPSTIKDREIRDDGKTAAAVPTPSGGVAKADPRRRLTPALPKNRATASTGDTGRLTRITSRMNQPTDSARRQAREEEAADRPSLVSRLTPLLKVAATVVVLLGVGGLIFRLFTGTAAEVDTASDSGSSAASSAPVLAQVQATGTNYSETDLRQQVDTLIADSQRASLKQSGPSAAADSSAGSAAPESAQATGSASSPLAATQNLLTSPDALRGCLSAIGAEGAQPLAVDLARWNQRDAAIIVLNADGGGYDVWVVARTCAPNADGTIAQEHIDS